MGDSDLQIPPRWSLHCASNDDTTTFVCSFASSTALAFVLAAASNFVCVHCRHATFYSPDATIGGRMYCTTRASTADAPIGGRISSNKVTNIIIIISININITIDTTGITTGTGIAINTGEILRKGLVQSLQLHRQGRRTPGEGGGYIQRLSPSGPCLTWNMQTLHTHTHTHTPQLAGHAYLDSLLN